MKTKSKASETDKQIGQKVRQFRNLKGMSQAALADRLGITFQQVQKYERGHNRVSSGTLYQIATILDVKVTEFFPDDGGTGTLSPEVIKLLKTFEGLDESILKALLKFVKEIKG